MKTLAKILLIPALIIGGILGINYKTEAQKGVYPDSYYSRQSSQYYTKSRNGEYKPVKERKKDTRKIRKQRKFLKGNNPDIGMSKRTEIENPFMLKSTELFGHQYTIRMDGNENVDILPMNYGVISLENNKERKLLWKKYYSGEKFKLGDSLVKKVTIEDRPGKYIEDSEIKTEQDFSANYTRIWINISTGEATTNKPKNKKLNNYVPFIVVELNPDIKPEGALPFIFIKDDKNFTEYIPLNEGEYRQLENTEGIIYFPLHSDKKSTSGGKPVTNSQTSADKTQSGTKILETYTVQKGDYLSLIAKKFGIKLENLIQWNDISNPNSIKPGQEIKLYDPALLK